MERRRSAMIMVSLLRFININIYTIMKTFKEFNEAIKYIGKTAVYATKDTSGGGTTSFTRKSKVVKHDKKFNVLTLDDGTKVNTVVHYRKDKKLYNKKDFYIESTMSEQKTIKVGEDAIGTDKPVHYAVVKERKVVATGTKEKMLAHCEKNGGRVWKTSSGVGDIVESTLNYARTRKEIEKERKMKNISKKDKDILGKIAKLMASLEEESELDEAYAIDTNPWQFSHKGVPKGKGNWAFDYVAALDSGGISALQKDTFISKAQSTYKSAVKQLTTFLKKNLKVKPKDVKIKLAP